MKKLTLERVVPIISASISWLIFGVEELVYQIIFDTNAALKHVGEHQLRKGGLLLKHLDRGRFL